jgi:hypothetical protein
MVYVQSALRNIDATEAAESYQGQSDTKVVEPQSMD